MDGSGVSHYNLVSPELLVELLKYMYFNSPEIIKFLKNPFQLPVLMDTLENRMRKTKAFDNVYAKTGTLSGVSTLSGYLKSANNHEIAFSIFVQNYIGSSRVARGYQDRICKFLSELKFRINYARITSNTKLVSKPFNVDLLSGLLWELDILGINEMIIFNIFLQILNRY